MYVMFLVTARRNKIEMAGLLCRENRSSKGHLDVTSDVCNSLLRMAVNRWYHGNSTYNLVDGSTIS
jgi:hypothetical protein